MQNIEKTMRVPALSWQQGSAVILGAALFQLALAFVGAVVNFVIEPAIASLKAQADSLVPTGIALSHLASAGIVLFALVPRSAEGEPGPWSVWSHNSTILNTARLVAAVYLAWIPVNFVIGEIRTFFIVHVGPLTRVDMFAGPGLAFVALVLPLLGINLVLALGRDGRLRAHGHRPD